MPRLFVALPLPEPILDALAPLQNGVPDARWLDEEALHVTLCFCGAVDGATMLDLIEALAEVEGGTLPLEIAGVELLGDGKRPRVLVASVVRSAALGQLRLRITNAARNAGVPIERRRFRPHVTLARFGARAEAGHHVAQFLASHGLFRAGPWTADSFILYSSRLSSDGAIYIPEAEYPLE